MLQSLYEKSEATNAYIVFCRFWTFNETTQKDETPEYDVSIDLLPENTVFSADTYQEFILNLYITAV